MSEILLGGTL